MHNDKIKSLYYICLDDDIDKIYKANNPPGFECDYRVQSSQVVDYPTNMGISGFCFKNDSICFINGFDSDYNKETPPRAFCLGKKRLTKFGQCLLAKYLLKDFPYNSKIDNLTNQENLDNIIISSITDEDLVSGYRPVGVLQLVNKKN